MSEIKEPRIEEKITAFTPESDHSNDDASESLDLLKSILTHIQKRHSWKELEYPDDTTDISSSIYTKFLESKLPLSDLFYIITKDHDITYTLIEIYLTSNTNLNESIDTLLLNLFKSIFSLKLPSQQTIDLAYSLACQNTYMCSNQIVNSQNPHLSNLIKLLDVIYSSFVEKSDSGEPLCTIIKHSDSKGFSLTNVSKISDYNQQQIDPELDLPLEQCLQGFSIQMCFKFIPGISEDQVQTLFSMELNSNGGIRLLIFENCLYYQVIDEVSEINSKIKIGDLETQKYYNLSLTHDRRLYGKSILFLKIDEQPTKEFDADYPKIAKSQKMTSFKVAESLNGYLNYFMYFDKPVEIDTLFKFYQSYPDGLQDNKVFQEIHEIFGINHSGLRIFISAFCNASMVHGFAINSNIQSDSHKVTEIERKIKNEFQNIFDGSSNGYIECMVSGNIFTFGDVYIETITDEPEFLGQEQSSLDEEVSEIKIKRIGGTSVQNIESPLQYFTNRQYFSQFLPLLFLQSKTNSQQEQVQFNKNMENLVIEILKFLDKFYPICLDYDLEHCIDIQTIMKISYFIKSYLSSITSNILKHIFLVFLKFSIESQSPLDETHLNKSEEHSSLHKNLSKLKSLLAGTWCNELILNPIILAKCSTTSYQYWSEFVNSSFIQMKEIVIFNEYLIKRIIFLLKFDYSRKLGELGAETDNMLQKIGLVEKDFEKEHTQKQGANQSVAWIPKSISFLLKQLLKQAPCLDITYTYEYLLTLLFTFDYPLDFYSLILTNIEVIINIEGIWQDKIFRRMFSELLDKLYKGLIRILGLCSKTEKHENSNLNHDKVIEKINESIMLTIISLICKLRDILLNEFCLKKDNMASNDVKQGSEFEVFSIPQNLKLDIAKVESLYDELLNVIQVTIGVVVLGIYSKNDELINRKTIVVQKSKFEDLLTNDISPHTNLNQEVQFEARKFDISEGILISLTSSLLDLLDSYIEKCYLDKDTYYPISAIYPLYNQMQLFSRIKVLNMLLIQAEKHEKIYSSLTNQPTFMSLLLQEYTSFQSKNAGFEKLAHKEEYLKMIEDFLVTMVQNGIDKKDETSQNSIELVVNNSWMLNLNLVVVNMHLKKLQERAEKFIKETTILDYSQEKWEIVKKHLTACQVKFKWQMDQRKYLSIYDEKFWAVEDLLDLESAIKTIKILEYFQLLQNSSQQPTDQILESVLDEIFEMQKNWADSSDSNLEKDNQNILQKHKQLLEVTLTLSTHHINLVFDKFILALCAKYYQLKMKSNQYLRISKMILEIFYFNLSSQIRKIENFMSELETSVDCKYHQITNFLHTSETVMLIDTIISFFNISVLENMKFLSMSHLSEKKEFYSYLKDFYTNKKDLAIQISEILIFNIDTEMEIISDNNSIGFSFGVLILYALMSKLDTALHNYKDFTLSEVFLNQQAELLALQEQLEIQKLKNEELTDFEKNQSRIDEIEKIQKETLKGFESLLNVALENLLKFIKTSLLSLDLSLLCPSHRPYIVYNQIYSHLFLYTTSYLYSKIEEFKSCFEETPLKKLITSLENLLSFQIFMCLFWNKEVIGVRLVANMIGTRVNSRQTNAGMTNPSVGALVYKLMVRDLEVCSVEDIEERGEQLLKSKYGSDLVALTQTQLQTKKIKKIISSSVHLNFTAYAHRYLDILSESNCKMTQRMVGILGGNKKSYHGYMKSIYQFEDQAESDCQIIQDQIFTEVDFLARRSFKMVKIQLQQELLFNSYSLNPHLLGNKNLEDGEVKLETLLQFTKFKYQSEQEQASNVEISNKQWTWTQDNREIIFDNFCPLLRARLNPEIITYQNNLIKCFEQSFQDYLITSYSEMTPKRILKLSNLYTIKVDLKDKVVYESNDICYMAKLFKIVPGRLLLSKKLLVFVKLSASEDTQGTDQLNQTHVNQQARYSEVRYGFEHDDDFLDSSQVFSAKHNIIDSSKNGNTAFKGFDRHTITSNYSQTPKKQVNTDMNTDEKNKSKPGFFSKLGNPFSKLGDKLSQLKSKMPDMPFRSTFYDNNPTLKSNNQNSQDKAQDDRQSKPYMPYSKLSILPFNLHSTKEIIKFWALDEITEISHQDFMHEKISLILKFYNCTQLQIIFQTLAEKETFLTNLPKKVQEKIIDEKVRTAELINQWLSERISNFDFISGVNKLGSRSGMNISQQPIFPWVTLTFEETEEGDQKKSKKALHLFRDLEKPTGFMIQTKRVNEFNRAFDKSTLDSLARPYFFDHYISSPFMTLDQGVRLQPFGLASELCSYYKKISKSNIKTSLFQIKQSATLESDDLRELTQEMFYLPEFYLLSNTINSDFQKEETIDKYSLTLPSWSYGSAFNFIQEHSKILECKKVSETLNNWINLIFGAWSTGRQARQYNNLYNEKFCGDLLVQKSLIKKYNHLERYMHETFYQGIQPPALFHKELAKKTKHCTGSLFCQQLSQTSKTVNLQINQIHIPEKKNKVTCGLVHVSLEQSEILIFSGLFIKIFEIKKQVTSTETEVVYNLAQVTQVKPDVCKFNFLILTSNSFFLVRTSLFDQRLASIPCCYLPDHNLIVIGGYLDGSIRICYKSNGILKLKFYPGSDKLNDGTLATITALNVVANHLAVGNMLGQLYSYKISDNSGTFHLGPETTHSTFETTQHSIIGIAALDENLTHYKKIEMKAKSDYVPFFYTWTKKTVMLISIPENKILSKISPFSKLLNPETQRLHIVQVKPVISNPCCVLIYSKSPHINTDITITYQLSTWSLNGVKIAEKQLDSHILGSIQIVEGNYYQKCAIWRDQKGRFWRYGLPMLELKGLDFIGEVFVQEDHQMLADAGIVREVVASGYVDVKSQELGGNFTGMRGKGVKGSNVAMESLIWLLDDDSLIGIEATKSNQSCQTQIKQKLL